MLVHSASNAVSLAERTEVGFLYRVLESGDLCFSSEEFDRLLVEHETYHDACSRCIERLIGQQAAELRDKIGLGKSILTADEIVEGRTAGSLIPGKYIEALGRLGLTERLVESVAFDGRQVLLAAKHSTRQEAS